MRRREFIGALGCAAVVGPRGALAQQALPTIGYLGTSSFEKSAGRSLLSFKRGLAEAGYTEGRNVIIHYRWAEDQYDRLPTLALELVQEKVAVLVAGGSPAALPAKAATTTIPIVFMIGSDPIELGLITSLNHPGSNLTGVAYLNVEVAPKRLELLHRLLPDAKVLGLLVNPAYASEATAQTSELQQAVNRFGLRLLVIKASSPLEIEEAFAIAAREHVEALQIGVDPLFGNHVDQIVALAARNKLPAIYPWREFTAAGGLMNYGSSIPEAFRLVGNYTGQILKGAKPADLPVQRSTRVSLTLNLKTARALGIEVPPSFSAIADEVIE
jgi:putative ABC transport system substrate-binding protein